MDPNVFDDSSSIAQISSLNKGQAMQQVDSLYNLNVFLNEMEESFKRTATATVPAQKNDPEMALSQPAFQPNNTSTRRYRRKTMEQRQLLKTFFKVLNGERQTPQFFEFLAKQIGLTCQEVRKYWNVSRYTQRLTPKHLKKESGVKK
ncbi:unnamed protein product [Caenorhabditis sp. 36 PRJEB53466]|nr:unnamed protein product [Caenorhabditis sp. 36 PRJEB53466]